MFEAMLQVEMNNHLGYESNDHGKKTTDNRRNGYTNKKVKTSAGEVDMLWSSIFITLVAKKLVRVLFSILSHHRVFIDISTQFAS